MSSASRRRTDAGARVPRRAPTVAALSSYAEHATCPTASVAFAAGVDTDHVLDGTTFASPFGQSPYAFARGTRFERLVKEDQGEGVCRYGPLLGLLRERLGFAVEDVRVENLRASFPRYGRGLRQRAQRTRALLGEIARGDATAPNLIDGAILHARVGGRDAFYEADGLAFRLGEQIHVVEIKSFPIVDEQAESEKLAAALDQGALYVLLIRRTLAELGLSPDLVADSLVLVCPRNVGLTPTLAVRRLGRRVQRVAALLERVPTLDALERDLPVSAIDFATVADRRSKEPERLEALADICDEVGVAFSDCCQGCGLYRFCRDRAFAEHDVALGGERLRRELAGIDSLRRAVDLADGAPAAPIEVPAAEQLRRLRVLRDAALRSAS